eukprot:CAMPEP_0171105750 /NCGR_PEP_ID=MMETSP0766_2-20121228/63373_1 /TAXON_ID=439317 /ORGANISM="Gambierdiscus australes, Strain CAWD 149" /LENGTH=210 /DNA_ID=CAMNT_0011566683 /DNA_START=110 /DNA_END=742 /DNA_ORIENTATION=-
MCPLFLQALFALFAQAEAAARREDVLALLQMDAATAGETDAGSVKRLKEEEALNERGPHPAEKIAALKAKVTNKAAEVASTVNKGLSNVNAKVEHSVGKMVSTASSAVDDMHSAASHALQGLKDFADSAAEPVAQQVNARSSKLNGKVKFMITKINKAIDDMKNGMHEFAHGMTEGLKEASEKVAAQLAQSVHEHVRQEIELARAAEPAS